MGLDFLLIKFHHSGVGFDVLGAEFLLEDDALQAAAAAEGDIGLAVFEGAPAEVYDGAVKGFALSFVDGYGPGEFEGVLGEGADDFFFELFGVFGIYAVFDDFPGVGLQFEGVFGAFFVGYFDEDFVFFEGEDDAYAAVDIAPVGVVADEHYLGAFFEGEGLGSGEEGGFDLAFYLGGEGAGRGRQFGEFPAVDLVNGMVAGGQGDVVIVARRGKVGLIAAVELFEYVVVHRVESHGIEQVEEALFLLAEDALQLHHLHLEALAEDAGREEVRALVDVLEDVSLLGAGNDGGQLEEVSHKEHLYAAEGPAIAAVEAQEAIHGVEDVGPNHGDFIYDEQLEVFVQAVGPHLPDVFGLDEFWRKPEKRVYGLPPHVEGCHAGGGYDDRFFVHVFADELQQGGFAGTCFAREEDILVGVGQQV